MALRSTLDFYCSVCLEVFKDPVLLSCSHSFCKPCLKRWWSEKSTQACPVCKRRSSKDDPPCNLVLKNLCEAFSEELYLDDHSQFNDICPQHGEKFKLFCLDHRQLVCLVCRDSKTHLNHSFRPVGEAAQDYKLGLMEDLKLLKINLDKLNQANIEWAVTDEHIKKQGRQTEQLIRDEFNIMRAFLQKEEEIRIKDLRGEVEKKRSIMGHKMAALQKQMDTFAKSIRETKEQLQSQDVTFLQNYETSVQRIKQDLSAVNNPNIPLRSLVDVAKHLGNLGFHVWSKMKELVTYTPVILDPNTACSFLNVTDDLCSVQHLAEVSEALPDNHERFKYFVTVLGSEGYFVGKHSWEVKVQGNTDWAVGVIAESMPRKEKTMSSGSWTLWRRDGQYVAFAPPFVDELLYLRQNPKRIKIELDCTARTLRFSDAQTNTHYYTFTYLFSEKLYPCIDTVGPTPVRILPVDITVQKNCI